MELWFAAVLGLIQGLTEFIPVSSTAHLRIAPELFGQADAGAAFSAVIQLGTLAALLVYYARPIFYEMPRAFLFDRGDGRSSPMGRMPIYLIAATIPIVAVGLTLEDLIVDDLRSLYVVATALIAVGAIMILADRKRGARTLADMTLALALAIGIAQTMALIPGVSRSGATIVCAVLLGFKARDAADFSFYLGIPAIGGAGLYELPDALAALEQSGAGVAPIVVGTAVSAVSGYACIAWLLRYLGRGKLWPFGSYRIAVGLVVVLLCAMEVLTP
jgi:undecaprenyl-diphosphatase